MKYLHNISVHIDVYSRRPFFRTALVFFWDKTYTRYLYGNSVELLYLTESL